MKKLIVLVFVYLIGYAVHAQDIDFPYVIYHEPTDSMIYINDDDILNFLSIRNTYKILGWNTDGSYFGSIISDPDNDGQPTLLLTDLVMEKFIPLPDQPPMETLT